MDAISPKRKIMADFGGEQIKLKDDEGQSNRSGSIHYHQVDYAFLYFLPIPIGWSWTNTKGENAAIEMLLILK